ncbi:hypothetical protein QJS10_CPB14g00008 [Acorus calamus]|uniref:Uncharacterized protein n=1 Tax=Acorus calamus TaxID=4465 RepID=A0AAV9DEY6_ACOCL|nr:hypothetical protein QJS10_CPB14g00008 [Acorus calamus]
MDEDDDVKSARGLPEPASGRGYYLEDKSLKVHCPIGNNNVKVREVTWPNTSKQKEKLPPEAHWKDSDS